MKMHHQICTLQTCQSLPGRPAFIPLNRGKGTKALGLAYEKKVGKALERIWPQGVRSGIWFEFLDDRPRWCQVDHFVVLPNQILLVECKLAEKNSAWSQMRDLYAPILSRLHPNRPVTRVQATKILRSGKRPIKDIREALLWPGGEFLWHNLG